MQTVLASAPAVFRPAEAAHLKAIVALLADDAIGALRETPFDLAPYEAAWERISADPNTTVYVALEGEAVIGTFQLTLIPCLALQGATRGEIEAVRVGPRRRRRGLGEAMIRFAIAEARRRGARIMQLTSNKARMDAHRFYERLGFQASHEGYKLTIDDDERTAPDIA